jgi:hypothetical protein
MGEVKATSSGGDILLVLPDSGTYSIDARSKLALFRRTLRAPPIVGILWYRASRALLRLYRPDAVVLRMVEVLDEIDIGPELACERLSLERRFRGAGVAGKPGEIRKREGLGRLRLVRPGSLRRGGCNGRGSSLAEEPRPRLGQLAPSAHTTLGRHTPLRPSCLNCGTITS